MDASVYAPDGVELGATVDLPDGPDVFGGLVVLHGAEMPERDFFLYEHLGETLPEHGWAVFRYDRRASEGTLPLDRQRDDARAAVEALRSQLPSDAMTGLWGFSQGAWTAIETAAHVDAVDLAVLVGFSAVTPAVQMRYATPNFLRAAGFPDSAVDALLVARDAGESYLRGEQPRQEAQSVLDAVRREPWFELAYLPQELPVEDELRAAADFMFFDPTSRLRETDVPLLVLYGDHDDHVPVDVCVRTLKALDGPELSVEVLEDVGHFLTHDDRQDAASLHDQYAAKLVTWLHDVRASAQST